MRPAAATAAGCLGRDRPARRTGEQGLRTARRALDGTGHDSIMSTTLLSYYEAIEKASAEMLDAARTGNWDTVVKLEGACAVLIAQLKNAAQSRQLQQNEAKEKSRI